MSLNESFFVSPNLVPRDVTLPDGSKHTIHFKELESSIFEKFHEHRASEIPAERYGAMATLIAAAVCDPDGKHSMTVAKALTLKPKVQIMLSGVIMELNGFREKKDSPSVEDAGSSTSSV